MKTIKDITKVPNFGFTSELRRLFKFKIAATVTRDSSLIERSNWNSFITRLDEIGSERAACYEIIHCRHWSCGWIDFLVINPRNIKMIELAEEILEKLEDYPVIDDDNYYQMLYNKTAEFWNSCGIEERIKYAKRARVSILRARKSFADIDNPDLELYIEEMIE